MPVLKGVNLVLADIVKELSRIMCMYEVMRWNHLYRK